MILIGKLTSEDTYLVKYICESAIYPIVYKGYSNVGKIHKSGKDFIIMDDERETWNWNIVIPNNVDIPSDMSIDNYSYNILTQVFTSNTSTVVSDTTEYNHPVKIMFPTGEAFYVSGSARITQSLNVGANLLVNKVSTFNDKIMSYCNTESVSLSTGAIIIGRTTTTTTARGGLAVLGNVNIGKLLTVYGATTLQDVCAVTNTSESINATTGALRVSGGIYVAKQSFIDGDILLNNKSIRQLHTTHPSTEISRSENFSVFKGYDNNGVSKLNVAYRLNSDLTQVIITDIEDLSTYVSPISGLMVHGKPGEMAGVELYNDDTASILRFIRYSSLHPVKDTVLGSLQFNSSALLHVDTAEAWSNTAKGVVFNIDLAPSGSDIIQNVLCVSAESLSITTPGTAISFISTTASSFKMFLDISNIYHIVGFDTLGTETSHVEFLNGVDTPSVHINSAIEVNGATSFNELVSFDKDTTFSAQVFVNNTLAVTGAATFNSTVNLSGGATSLSCVDTDVAFNTASNDTISTALATKTLVADTSLATLKKSMNSAIDGMLISNNVTTPLITLDVSTGTVLDDTFTTQIALSTILSKDINATFVIGVGGGLVDTYTVAASTAYAVYAIYDSTNIISDVCIIPATEAFVYPTTGVWSHKRYLGLVFTNSSSEIIPTVWTREGSTQLCQFITKLKAINNIAISVTESTYAMLPSTNRALTIFGNLVSGLASASAPLALDIASANTNLSTPSITSSGNLVSGFLGALSTLSNSAYFELVTNALSQLKLIRSGDYLDSNSQTSLFVWGYREIL